MLTLKSVTVKSASRYLGSACSAAMILGWGSMATAQVTISDERTAPVDTTTEGDDVIIDTSGSVVVTTAGPAVTLNSDNSLTNQGSISIADVDDATGVSLEGGANRSFSNIGSISLTEETPDTADADENGFNDRFIPTGSGRTGILISGASPFEGDITLASEVVDSITRTSSVSVQGNESFGVNFATDLVGNFTNEGSISLSGDNGSAVNVAGNVTGDLDNRGTISVLGANSTGYSISGDIEGGFVNSGAIAASGFLTNNQRLNFGGTDLLGREDLAADDLANAGSAVSISGNISEGIHFDLREELITDSETGEPVLDEDGNETFFTASTSNIAQFGSAPAVLINGDGTPIAIGRVSQISDPTDDDFDESLRFGFVNEGTINSQGLFDDFDATVISISQATIEGGLSNTGTLSVSTFRNSERPENIDVTDGTGLARVIVLGEGAIVDQINNSGLIRATATEAVDDFFADSTAPQDSVALQAIAIDIGVGATTTSITNSGVISTVLIGRQGEAYAVRDLSGSLSSFVNEGGVLTLGQNSDSTGEEEVDFALVALDVSTNTSGFTFTQRLAEDEDTTDDVTPTEPFLIGDMRFGSGDDTVDISSGTVTGDIDFAEGEDQLLLSGGASFGGSITDDGTLTIAVTDSSTLALTVGEPLAVADASFGAGSTFSPTIDGSTGTASTLVATGDILFDDGSFISPRFTSIVDNDLGAVFSIASADGILTASDILLAELNASTSDGTTPFLYDFEYGTDLIDGSEALIVTVTLRDPNLSIEQGGLGLDSVQAAAFDQTRTALVANTDLGSAIANITDGDEFNRAYNQLLPEFSAAAREFVLANVDGATGAVGSHLDTARRSPEKTGGAWLQEFAYFADRELAGLSEQYRGAGFGFTGGLDTAFGPFHAVGVNFGFASTEIEDVGGTDEPLDVITLQAGLYAGLARAMGSGELGLELYAGGGYNQFEQNRVVRINDFFGQASSDYAGTHLNGSARLGYDIALSDRFWIRPSVSLDYLRLSEDGYTETGTEGIALDVSSRVSERASASAMLNMGAKFQGRRTWIRPAVRVGYRQALLNDPVLTEFAFAGLSNAERATLNSMGFPDSGFLVGFSIAAGSEYSSIGFDVDSDIRDGFIRHTGRVVIRLLF